MTSTPMQVRLTSAVAALAAVATLLLATATLFSAPVEPGVVALAEVVVTPNTAPAQIAHSVRASNTVQN